MHGTVYQCPTIQHVLTARMVHCMLRVVCGRVRVVCRVCRVCRVVSCRVVCVVSCRV
jgi:hypothetical protein